MLEALSEGLQMFLGASEAKEQFVRIQPPLSSYMFAHQPIYPDRTFSVNIGMKLQG